MNISPKAQNNQNTIHRPHEAQEEVTPQCECFVFFFVFLVFLLLLLLFEKGKNTHRGNYGDKVWGRDWRKGHPETVLCGDSWYKQSPNSDIIMDVKKCILKGACYGCLLRGPARDSQIQRQMLAINHCAESGVPNIRPIVERKYLHLSQSAASQRTAIPGSYL